MALATTWALQALGCATAADPTLIADTRPLIDAGIDSPTPDANVPDGIEQPLHDTAKPDTLPGPPPNAIHVSPVGKDSPSCGATPQSPCQTLTQGIKRAASYQPARPVVATGGNYLETITVENGVDILGGYNAQFQKGGPGNIETTINGVIDRGVAVAVRAKGITALTSLDSVIIVAPDAKGAGRSSYGVLVERSPGLRLKNCEIKAGSGQDGVDGKGKTTPAPSGKTGGAGIGGGQDLGNPEPIGCPKPQSGGFGDRGLGAAAVSSGSLVCQGKGGDGGLAGIDSCDGLGGQSGAGAAVAPVVSCSATSGGQGGSGGAAGDQDQTTCKTNKKGTAGALGCDGRSGSPGEDGKPGVGGATAGGLWTGANGEDGKDGLNNASGGGGGGGGGGGDCDFLACTFKCVADRGGGGGGGGSAGCPGAGGSGGTAGGGSFGVFIVGSTHTLNIDACTITTGNGGKGGAGGKGQPGGVGGQGGQGGGLFQEAGAGGKGGKGGDGGRGGHGGGGAGGPSVGIYVASGTPPAVTNTKVSTGNAGKGGASDGFPGRDGVKMNVGP